VKLCFVDEEGKIVMEIQLDSKIVKLVTLLEIDITMAINEALTIWLKKRLPVCPITNLLCEYPQGSCNHCPIAEKKFSKADKRI